MALDIYSIYCIFPLGYVARYGETVMDHDFCNSDGARRLKQRIEEHWQKEYGLKVDVKLVGAGFVAAMRSARTDVRSDMVNGYPRAYYERLKAERAARTRPPVGLSDQPPLMRASVSVAA